MKTFFTIISIIAFSTVWSQEHSIEPYLSNKVWMPTAQNQEISLINIYGTEGWEMKDDSMIVAYHCYQSATYHKVDCISADTLVLRAYRSVNHEGKGMSIEPTDSYYYFKSIKKSGDEENLWNRVLYLANKKRK